MSDLMKRAHELAPFVAEALCEVADEATVPEGDEREWTERQKASRDFAVELARAMISGEESFSVAVLLDSARDHAESARDAEVNDG